MKRLIALAGLVLIGAPAIAAAATPLYDTIKKTVELELNLTEDLDADVVQFIHRVLADERIVLTTEEIEGILGDSPQDACAQHESATLGDCIELIPRVQLLAMQEMRVRRLGHNLQIAATSFEVPISDLPGRASKLASDLRGILSIWSAGTGSIKSTINSTPIRSKGDENGAYDSLLNELGTALKDLNEEERIAAVWRYQYGVRLIKDERAPRFPAPFDDQGSGAGTERQYIFKRWTPVEEKLAAIWDKAKNDPFDPPLEANETGYITFKESVFDNTLPENVIVWIRMDADAEHPFGDVGLQWKTPLEPVQPSLLKDGDRDTPILGGDYPPEPRAEESAVAEVPGQPAPEEQLPEGRGLCTSPGALRGYLCRPFIAVAPEERCPEEDDAEANPNEIRLTTCVNTGSIRHTAAGADVCREVNWENSKPFDPNRQCILALRCSNDCNDGVSLGKASFKRKSDSVVDVCVEGNNPGATYILYHELVHAYQFCSMPVDGSADLEYDTMPFDEANALCCRIEGEAHRASCSLMEADGLFDSSATFQGVPMNAETCAEAGANVSCGLTTHSGKPFKPCFTSRTYPTGFFEAVVQKMNTNPKDLPAQCDAILDPKKMDARVADLIEAIERQNHVCSPGNQSNYVNRIGNNACYIGQCVEQSVELHNISAGRTPTTVGDEVAPWHSPEAGTPLGNILINPPDVQLHLPVYRPAYLAQQLDTTLCQLQGLPPQTPPILCMALANRQLEATRLMGINITESLLTQRTESENIFTDMLHLAPSVGIRMGSTLYADYMRGSSQSFASLLNMASKLLEDLTKINFPKNMCPIEPGLPPPNQPSS